MTIDVAKLRRFAEEAGWPSVSPSEFVELLDAYEERDRLRAALTEQGFLQKTALQRMVWHIHDCPASFDFAQCNYRCRVARAALEGRE